MPPLVSIEPCTRAAAAGARVRVVRRSVRRDTTLVAHGDTSTSFERIAEVAGLRAGAATHPIARVIAGIRRDIASGSPVYAGPFRRVRPHRLAEMQQDRPETDA